MYLFVLWLNWGHICSCCFVAVGEQDQTEEEEEEDWKDSPTYWEREGEGHQHENRKEGEQWDLRFKISGEGNYAYTALSFPLF